MELANKTVEEYRRWISEADLLLIAYNFDEKSLRYTQYSMANKMPECLASGVPVLAHGPQQAATINYLAGSDFARVVSTPDPEELQAAIRDLHGSPEMRAAIGAAGRRQALAYHNIHSLRDTFASLIVRAAKSHMSQQDHSKWVSEFTDDLGVLRAKLLKLSSEVLLGRKTLGAKADDAAVSELIAQAQANLPVDDLAIAHFQGVCRLKARPA
jgi:hypothetical protein